MSLLKKVQQRSVERKFGGTHPILRMGLDRNTVDAYFTGLVFAAVADDEAIDDAERQKLVRIGSALNIPEEDVRSMMSDMLARDSDAKIAIAEECANVLKGSPSVRLFVCEWSQVWMSHNYKQDELDEFREQLCEWLGVGCDTTFFKAFDVAVKAANEGDIRIEDLFASVSDDHLAYLFGGEEVVKQERRKFELAKEAADKKAKYEGLRRQKDLVESFLRDMDACCSKLYKLNVVKDKQFELMRSALADYVGNLTMTVCRRLTQEVEKRFEDELVAVENRAGNGMSPKTKKNKPRGFFSGVQLICSSCGVEVKNLYADQSWVGRSLRKGVWSLICIGTVYKKVSDERLKEIYNSVLNKMRLTIGGNVHTPKTLRTFWDAEVIPRLSPR